MEFISEYLDNKDSSFLKKANLKIWRGTFDCRETRFHNWLSKRISLASKLLEKFFISVYYHIRSS